MNTHVRYRSAKAALAAAIGLALAGCGASAATSGTATSGAATSGTATSGSAAGATTSSGSGAAISAASLPFPVAVGNTWVYDSTVPSAGTISTVTNKILSVAPVAGGSQVTESYHDSLSSKTSQSVYIYHSDGTITFPLSQVSGGTLTTSGGILLPDAAAISSGQPYKSVLQIGFKEGGTQLHETAHVTVQGAGTATVTVPAGTYQATIVDMTMAWSMATITVSIEIKDWVATGTGTVKSEASIHEGGVNQIVATEQLTSFTKG
jgi:hypothetical protein